MITLGALLFFISGLLAGFISGLLVGNAAGQKHGRDAQWIDDFIDAGKRDRARRNRLGQYSSRKS